MSVVEFPRRARASICLRSPQANYLHLFARQEGLTISDALGGMIANYADEVESMRPSRPVQKVMQNVVIPEDQFAILTRLAGHLGLSRSEVARRIIDQARGVRILEMC